MGRYANFNTGLEYKFGFAIQESSDITCFGGQDLSTDGDLVHVWKAEDAPKALDMILTLRAVLEAPEIRWDEFPQTLDGTEALRQHLYESLFQGGTRALHYRLFLGCLIYHQLLYMPILSANYE